MKKIVSSIMGCSWLVLTLGAVEPVYQWDFNKWQGRKTYDKTQTYKFYATPNLTGGAGGSGALNCQNKCRQLAFFNLDWQDFTCELNFKLATPLDGKHERALFSYETDAWNLRRLFVYIDKQGRIKADFRIYDNTKKQAKEYKVISDTLKIQAGKFYTFRLATSSGKTLKMWLDNQLIAEQDKAWGLIDLKTPEKVEWYPIFGVGFRRFNPSKLDSPLNGVIDNLKLWNKFVEPDVFSDQSSGEVSRHLTMTGEWSAPFQVLDRAGKLLGSYVRAENKFVQNAGRAQIQVQDSNLVVKFRCPIPAGLSAQGGNSAWRGDNVEFFFRPSLKSTQYFHYAVNVSGEKFAEKNSAPGAVVPNFHSQFQAQVRNEKTQFTIEMSIPLAELGISNLAQGQVFYGNFNRSGRTAGGLSTWAPVGDSFHNIDGFAPLIVGSRQSYFEQKLQAQQAAAQKHQVDLIKLTQLIKTQGNKPQSFDRINQAFKALEMTFVQKILAHTPQLIYQNEIWDNTLQINKVTRPLKKLKITMPQNSWYCTGFAVANLTDQDFLGQIKCFPDSSIKKVPYSFSRASSLFCRQIKFYEGIASRNTSGKNQYDALAPLPLNTLLRLGPHKIAPIWLEFSSQNLASGIYRGQIVLKNCDTSKLTMVELELEVKPVDLAQTDIDTFYYNELHADPRFTAPGLHQFLGKHRVNYVYFCPGQIEFYPEQNADGSLQPMDFSEINRMFDSAIQGGIAPEKIKVLLYLALDGGYGMRRIHPTYKNSRFPIMSQQWQHGMVSSLQQFAAHIHKRYGITKDRIVLYPVDEPSGDIANPQSRMYKTLQFCQFLKKNLPDLKIMENPHPGNFSADRQQAFLKLADYVDIFELYRLNVTASPQLVKFIRSLKKEVWTYSIIANCSHPGIYRNDYWRNMHDKFSAISTYWHLDAMAGGDGFDANDVSGVNSKNRTDYGTIYVDFEAGSVLPSRRFWSGRLGAEERRIYEYCQQKIAVSTRKNELQKELDKLIAQGADSSMEQLEKIRVKLLDFAAKL